MGFANLRPQGPLFPIEAELYAKTALQRSEAAAAKCRTILDVPYGAHPDQQLDIYLPQAAVRAAPVVVFAHGGGWTHGHKEWMGLMAPAFVAQGICFVSVNHRRAPEHKYPMPMDDCAAALGWIHQHAPVYGLDPDRILVGGHSSGGHLYAMVALQARVLERIGVPQQSILACAPLSARLDLDFEGRLPGSIEARHHEMLFRDPAEAAPASPIAHLTPGIPYFLLAWGTRDIEGVARSNERMRDALVAKGLAHECLLLEADHFQLALDTGHASNPWVRRVIEIVAAAPARF